MKKWIIGLDEAVRESEVHKIKISKEAKDNLFMAYAYDKHGMVISTLACEIGKDKFNKKLNSILNNLTGDDDE